MTNITAIIVLTIVTNWAIIGNFYPVCDPFDRHEISGAQRQTTVEAHLCYKGSNYVLPLSVTLTNLPLLRTNILSKTVTNSVWPLKWSDIVITNGAPKRVGFND